jgi:hypothetical protein
MKISINEVLLDTYDYNIEEIISEPTGNKLRKIIFHTSITGIVKKTELEDILSKKILRVKIEDEDIEFKAEKENRIFSYNGNGENDYTEYNYEIILIELDKDLPEEWNTMAAIYEQVIMNWIRTRAISSLLIDKGIFTEDEYLKRLDELGKKDFDNLRKLLAYGIPEPKKDRN